MRRCAFKIGSTGCESRNALDKYIKLLTQQLTKSILFGRNVYMQSNDLYTISVAKQRNRGSQIGSNKIRLHYIICNLRLIR